MNHHQQVKRVVAEVMVSEPNSAKADEARGAMPKTPPIRPSLHCPHDAQGAKRGRSRCHRVSRQRTTHGVTFLDKTVSK
jgi:hypothetical protein